ncbi:hypothetical protein LJ739_19025 [Aestuariibacter halophilus]|uniref:Uncharacterized protein n=1 Tax=Fluctibacter halophilus TaxID=226011 RepID=A0ABS8GF01_9ALTE|nr:hypothetical protein [Aestuariibacter halophilus]MCC2618354.1 hypothetical protein [Aestuariibacter halophilus]
MFHLAGLFNLNNKKNIEDARMLTTSTPDNVTSSNTPSQDSIFFSRLAMVITATVFGGFILHWVANYEQLGRFTLWIGLHGAFSVAWYLLLLYQIRLSTVGNIATHRRWGKLSVILVIAILFSGVMMTLGLYGYLVDLGAFDFSQPSARARAGGLIGGTFLEWAIFAALYILGIVNVRSPAHHKRFMLASAVQMMPEGLNRLIHVLGLPGYGMLGIMLLIYLSMMMYDWRSARRIYWSTLVAFALFLLMALLIYTLFRTQAWGDWVVSILGGM